MPNRYVLGEIGYMAQWDALYESLTGFESAIFCPDEGTVSR